MKFRESIDFPTALSPRASTRGHITLYALLLLPITLGLALLVVDVSSWRALRQHTQQEIDRISFEASKLLPDVSAAEDFVHRSLSKSIAFNSGGIAIKSVNLQVTSGEISLELETQVKSTLLNFSQASSGAFTVRESATVKQIPSDVILVFSNGASLAPAHFDETNNSAWGTSIDWPVANEVAKASLPCLSSTEGVQYKFLEACKSNAVGKYKRWLTQTCFNPIFAALKSASIVVHDEIAKNSSNRIGIFAVPGDFGASSFSELSPLSFFKEHNSDLPVRWSAFFDTNSLISDEACAYFSDAPYQLPAAISQTSETLPANCSLRPQRPSATYYPINNLDSCFLEFALDERLAIHTRAIRPFPRSGDAIGVIHALEYASTQFSEALSGEQLQASRTVRGALGTSPNRIVIAIVDELPPVDNNRLNLALDNLRTLDATLLLTVYAHDGLSVADKAELQNKFNDLLSQSNLKFEGSLVFNPTLLTETVVTQLFRHGRTYALTS